MLRITKKMVQKALDETEQKWRYLAGEDVEYESCGLCLLNSEIQKNLNPSQLLDYSCMDFCPISDNSGKACCSEYNKSATFDTEEEEHNNARHLLKRLAKIDITKTVREYNTYLRNL